MNQGHGHDKRHEAKLKGMNLGHGDHLKQSVIDALEECEKHPTSRAKQRAFYGLLAKDMHKAIDMGDGSPECKEEQHALINIFTDDNQEGALDMVFGEGTK